MDVNATAHIPDRARHHLAGGPRKTMSGNSSSVHLQPASTEVISNLITSLSFISTPQASCEHLTRTPSTSAAVKPSFKKPEVQSGPRFHGSLGIDYGAYDKSSARQSIATTASLDNFAAYAPLIKTSRPPSGYSSLPAPRSPQSPTVLRSSFGYESRPLSRESEVDDARSIGTLSIEPGSAASPDLVRRGSADSWGKRQGRANKSLKYMTSKEKLRVREQDKRLSLGQSESRPGLHRINSPRFEETFLADSIIGEEPEEIIALRDSTDMVKRGVSPSVIPVRDSSLRTSAVKKRSTKRTSRHSKTGNGDVVERVETFDQGDSEKNESQDRKSYCVNPRSPELFKNLEVKASSKFVFDEDGIDEEEFAPSPTIAQRKIHHRQSLNQSKKSGLITPEPQEAIPHKRKKRISTQLSPTRSERNSRVISPENPLSDERPTSADSVDEAVDAYLCSPRLSQKIRHPQTGRTISFSEVGDSEGFAVFCCVGMGLTRYITAFYDELALTLKLRLITPDRPGVGESEPYTDGIATPLSWPDDVYAICQALKITKFSILAHSAGAIYALATALRMPQHIRGRIHLLAPWIPPSQMNVFGGQVAMPPSSSLPTSQRILRALPTPILKAANSGFMSATSSSITSSLPKQRRTKHRSIGRDTPGLTGRSTITPGLDKEHHGRNSTIFPDPSEHKNFEADLDDSDPNSEAAILAAAANSLAVKERQVTYDSRLTQSIWELSTQGANPAVDLLVCLERRHTIGFRYVDITRAVVIHHGSKDTRVPVENVRWLGKTMKRCEVRVLQGEGHGLMASASVMSGILTEIAREWEDWMKVTSSAAGHRTDGLRRTMRERGSSGAFR